MNKRGYILRKSPTTPERQLVSRIHRLEGQVRSLERVLGGGEPSEILTQFAAVIAAAKAAYAQYVEIVANDPNIPSQVKQEIISRVIKAN